jgi:copper chaperone CopZ
MFLSRPLVFDVPFKTLGLKGSLFLFLQISGMTCSSCVHTIESGLADLPGMLMACVSLSLNKGQFKFDPSKTNIRNIKEAIEVRCKSQVALNGVTYKWAGRCVI